MTLTRVIAGAIIVVSAGLGNVQAQSLRNATPPAEFPAPSYKGKQYVDSKGCVYIRAGIDGNVTWVPRVTRQRKQVCGYKPTGGPTAVAGGQSGQQGKAPVQLTVKPAPDAVVAPVVKPKPAPKTVRAKPVTPVKPKAVPTTTTTQVVVPKPKPVPRKQVKVIPVTPTKAKTQTKTKFAAKPAPVIQAAPALPLDTRVVPRHVYDNRQNTTNFKVPKGYRSVWKDDRLNPKRAERTLRPAVVTTAAKIPRGYGRAWDDGRLSRTRAMGTARGDAQTDLVWTKTVPRTLVPVPTQGQVVTIKSARSERRKSLFGATLPAQPQERTQTVARLSTRSAPVDPPARRTARITSTSDGQRYVRVATYTNEADARTTARALAKQGLPMRLGTVKRIGKSQKVVLAGPFATTQEARAALSAVQSAGFTKARINK